MTSCWKCQRAQPINVPSCAIEVAIEESNLAPSLYRSPDWICENWWDLFGDAQLSNFIDLAFIRNPTLQIAQANMLLAVASSERLRATLFPNLFWGADVSRQKLSETGVVPFGNTNVPIVAQSQIPEYFTQYETQLTLSYEFDLWGKNRNALRAALSEVQASIADTIFSRLQLAIAIARTYFQLQVNYKRKKIAEALISNRVKYLTLIQQKVREKVDNALSLITAETNLSVTQQRHLEIENEIAINEYQLKAYLAGNFEECIDEVAIECQPLPRIPIPEELPLQLIAHRPDIASQLWLIESAGRQIEVAKAGFYPNINLSALFGFQTIHFHELLKWPSTYFNINPAISLPIFDGGRLMANLHGSQVNYDLAIYQYNSLVLQAVQEVLTALANLKNGEKLLELHNVKVGEEQNLVKLVETRVLNGIDSQFNYLQSEQELLVMEDQALVTFGNTLQAVLSLIKALGGGYN